MKLRTPNLRSLISFVAGMASLWAISAFAQAPLPGAPETNGLSPKSATAYLNGINGINNNKTEHLSIDIAKNGNVVVAWEDDGNGITDFEAVWTLLDPNGNMITPMTEHTNRSVLGALATYEVSTNQYLSFFRSDGTATPPYMGWGTKVRANRYGDGFGFGAMVWEIGLEVPELYDINEDAGGPPPDANDFLCVQLLNNDGTPLRLGTISGITNLGIVTFADADVQPAGAIRIGGWDYLSSGNIVLVGDSRQADDRALTGQASGNVPVYRVVTKAGIEVKGYAAVSATPDAGSIYAHGVGVTANGFAIRWNGLGGANLRFFDNGGNPQSTNVQLASLTGFPQAGQGGDGGDTGFSGNGKDTYVVANPYSLDGTNGVWVTVLNTNGTVRWSRDVADDLTLVTGTVQGADAAVDEAGGVVVVFAGQPDFGLARGVMGRHFDATGKPTGGSFYISEREVPDYNAPPLASSRPRVACRNGKVAVAWESTNDPDLVLSKVVAVRLFTTSALPGKPEENGLVPSSSTVFINGTNGVNNKKTEHLSVDIVNNGNVVIGWEDDGNGISDQEGVWTLVDKAGSIILPELTITNRSTAGAVSVFETLTSRYLSFFRSDNTPIGGYTGWGPAVKANRFGKGFAFGSMPWEIGLEIPELYDINEDGGGPPPDANDFPCVQLLNDDGTPLRLGTIVGITNLGIVTFADESVQPGGSIRLGGFDYLSNSNIVVVGESRQIDDIALTGQSGGRVPVYRIVTPGGIEIKAYSAVSSSPDAGNISRNGVAVAGQGFAVRWQGVGGANVRLFDNSGAPITTNLQLAAITGSPQASGGGDGGNAGIGGNGMDAYVLSGDYSQGYWVTVLNTNGTVRWSRDVADDLPIVAGSVGGGDAAIDESGQVLVTFHARVSGVTNSIVLGRRFDATGAPVGGTFYLSEKEVPVFDPPIPASTLPRVAWRNGQAVAIWRSGNYPYPDGAPLSPVIAERQFSTAPAAAPSLQIGKSGNVITISWAPSAIGYTLYSSGNISAPMGSWAPVNGVVNNSISITNPVGTAYYRLKQ